MSLAYWSLVLMPALILTLNYFVVIACLLVYHMYILTYVI